MYQEGSRYFLEVLLDLTEKGRSFDQRMVYTDLTLSIDAVKEAQIKARRPDVVVVTLQHLRDEFQDSQHPESTRFDMMLDFVKLTLVATQQSSAAPAFAAGDGAAAAARPGPRRNDRKRRIDQPTWESQLWLPVRRHMLKYSCVCIPHAFAFKGIMTAFGDSRDTSIDSIRVVEGLLAHFVKVFQPHFSRHGRLRPFPELCASLTLQRVVGAALEYAEDPLEVSQLDVLHVLRKNKRFLGRVTTTHSHLQNNKERFIKSKIYSNPEQERLILATRTFDDEGAAPSRDDAAAAAPFQDSHDASREAACEASVVSRPVIKFRSVA
jgi:hypothetical protein